MWVARDKNGELHLFLCKPSRIGDEWYFDGESLKLFGRITDEFENIRWEDEPVEVNLSQCANPNKILDIIRECGFRLSVMQENILYNKLKSINYDTI